MTANISLRKLIANMSVRDRASLARLAGMQFSRDRDVDVVCGYTVDPDINNYRSMYERRGIASTIVDAPAETSWRKTPQVEDGSEGKSDFMKGWKELRDRLNVYHYMERVDRLTGVGRYGVMLIGTKDGKLSEPLERVNSPADVIFLSTFSESYATIKSLENDVHNPRFGQPSEYTIDLHGDISVGSGKSIGMQTVHWSRVIHVAERLLENEVYGEPRLQKVFNYLEGLDKVVGGAPEGFWQTAVPGYALSAKEGYEMDDTGKDEAKEEFQEYLHGLQRLISVEGLDFDALKGTIGDPGPAFTMLISLIAGKTRIPQRILLGSERGDLASSQDEANWLGRIAERRIQFAEPRILRPTIDRLIAIKALPAPQDGSYEVGWPNLFYLTGIEQADVYQSRASAISSVSGKFPLDLFTPEELREAVGFNPEREEEPITEELDENDKEVQAEFLKLQNG